MSACYFYNDAKGRTYYLPETTIQKYKKDSRRHIFPQGVKKAYTCDHYVLYFQHPYEYPPYAKALIARMGQLTFAEVKREILLAHSKCNATVLNIPRDIFKYLLVFLDKSTLACLHLSCRFFQTRIVEKPDLKNLSLNAIRENHWKLFLWSREFNLPKKSKNLLYAAAETQNLNILIKLHNLGYPLHRNIMSSAVTSLPMLKWVAERCKHDHTRIFEYATFTGNVEMFDWAKKRYGTVVGHKLAYFAAKNGKIPMLQSIEAAHLLGNSCPYQGAIDGDKLHVLKWLKQIEYSPPYLLYCKKPHLAEWIRSNWPACALIFS